MAVLLTNGASYIAHSSTGAVIKVQDREKARDFHTSERAIRQKQKAPGKCAGFYCMDTDLEKTEPDAQEGMPAKRKRFSAKDRLAVYRKTEGHCYLCGEFVDFDSFEVEHHTPISKGGTNGLDNLYCSCTTCNAIKRDIYPEEFMGKITQIFLYQMQKEYGDSLEWKVAYRLLEAMQVRKREECKWICVRKDGGNSVKIDLKPCPYCGGIAKGYIKTVKSFRKIHNYYVTCTECGASIERYDTEFAILQNGKFHVLTHKEAIRKTVSDWNNGIFDTQTRLLHMTEQEKILWYTVDLLKVAWYGVNVLVGSLRWETAWKLRRMAEERKLLRLSSGKDYNLAMVADELLRDDTVKCIVISYLEEIRNDQEDSANGNG